MIFSRRRWAGVLALSVLLTAQMVSSFQPAGRTAKAASPLAPTVGRPGYVVNTPYNPHQPSSSSSTSLNSFMGSDGGLLGIGTPELATILLVGYFVLGPSDLYKLVKEIGKFISNVRTLGDEATKNFETSMESQLELKELRNAQRELNDAFSFRRSINVDDDEEAFSTNAQSPRDEGDFSGAPAAVAAVATPEAGTGEAPPKRKKKRRRIKKKVVEEEPELVGTPINNVPDLDMNEALLSESTTTKAEKKDDWFADDIEKEKEEKIPSVSDMMKEEMEWLKDSEETTTPAIEEKTPEVASAEQNRFQQQLSNNWNDQVMANEDKLAPMAMIMEKLALLEEEKVAADKRLEDEFRQRFQQEEDFYQKKRELLEEGAAKVQEEAYVTMDKTKK